MLFKYLRLGLFLFLGSVVLAQTTESEKLLQQAEEMVFYNPTESHTIAQHVLKLADSDQKKTQSLYLSALSNFVMGNYDQSLSDAFLAKDLAHSNKEIERKSVDLIHRILDFLQLKNESPHWKMDTKKSENSFAVETHLKKAQGALNRNQYDSVTYYLKSVSNQLNKEHPGLFEAIYSKVLGDFYFDQQENEKASSEYHKSLDLAKKINNLFLQYEVHQNLARNYLAMDSLAKFQESSQWAKEISLKTSKIENDASGLAHKLISNDWDKVLEKSKSRNQLWTWVIFSIFFLILLTKVVLYFRNKEKIKTYQILVNYLKRVETPEKKEISKEIVVDEIPVSEPKVSLIQKESELQILQGLEKFEASKKFTNKDMSLGMLASQLNTNTKYLSEVINRQKQKNFNAYINELRINYITDKIRNNPSYLNYKVSYLAEECGFSSHSSFTTVFKSVVGVSPIAFLDFVKEEMQKEKSVDS